MAARAAISNVEEARASASQTGRWIVTLVFPAIGLTWLAGGALLSIYGDGFRSGWAALVVLMVATGLQGLLVLLDNVLMVHRPALSFVNSLVAISVQLAASLVLIPRHGPLGAALGALCATGVHAALRIAEIRIIAGWHWPWRTFARPALASIVAFVPALVVRLSWSGVAGELVAASTMLAAYIWTWRIIGLETDDRALAQAVRGTRPGS